MDTKFRHIGPAQEVVFTELYGRYADNLYVIIRKIIGIRYKDNVPDLLQDTFLKAWHHIDEYDASKGLPGGWLFQIAKNLSLNHLKYMKFRSNLNNGKNIRETDPQIHPDILFDKLEVSLLLKDLNRAEINNIRLRYFHGLRQQELAVVQGKSVANIKKLDRTALCKLRRKTGLEEKRRRYHPAKIYRPSSIVL